VGNGVVVGVIDGVDVEAIGEVTGVPAGEILSVAEEESESF